MVRGHLAGAVIWSNQEQLLLKTLQKHRVWKIYTDLALFPSSDPGQACHRPKETASEEQGRGWEWDGVLGQELAEEGREHIQG